jgi:hypothetical protein
MGVDRADFPVTTDRFMPGAIALLLDIDEHLPGLVVQLVVHGDEEARNPVGAVDGIE